jgi:hypothetical protein
MAWCAGHISFTSSINRTRRKTKSEFKYSRRVTAPLVVPVVKIRWQLKNEESKESWLRHTENWTYPLLFVTQIHHNVFAWSTLSKFVFSNTNFNIEYPVHFVTPLIFVSNILLKYTQLYIWHKFTLFEWIENNKVKNSH